jgi:hypothetical protein
MFNLNQGDTQIRGLTAQPSRSSQEIVAREVSAHGAGEASRPPFSHGFDA